MQVLHGAKFAVASQTQPCLLHFVTFTGYGRQTQGKVGFGLLYISAFGTGEDSLSLVVPIINRCALDFWAT
jgi:hypothetical protein